MTGSKNRRISKIRGNTQDDMASRQPHCRGGAGDDRREAEEGVGGRRRHARRMGGMGGMGDMDY